MTTCPSGHPTRATDYCDVCGLPVEAAGETAVLPVVPAGPAKDGPAKDGPAKDGPAKDGPAEDGAADVAAGGCPNCSTANPPDALFCEACGYDFTTGSLPRPIATADATADATAAATGDADPPVATPADDANPSPALSPGWVAEIWIDPDWYADQASTDALPSPGLPIVLPLAHQSVLVGRASRSRGITPDIDLSSDNGISRRHAQLTSDGTRWWVEDLGSSNGTYVGPAVGPLPTRPVPQGQRQEISADDRVYLGAWTRLVVRKAAPGEG